MLDFLASYWPFLVALFVIVMGVFAFRGVRKALKEGGGAFSLETIKKNTEPNFAALKQKSHALLADADMICEVKEGSHLVVEVLPPRRVPEVQAGHVPGAGHQQGGILLLQDRTGSPSPYRQPGHQPEVPRRQEALQRRCHRRKAEIPSLISIAISRPSTRRRRR